MSRQLQIEQLQTEYTDYLKRVETLVGPVNPGKFVKFEGQLVKILDEAEFVERWDRYAQVRQAYDEIMCRGDTVNDAIVHLLNEHAAELLIKV